MASVGLLSPKPSSVSVGSPGSSSGIDTISSTFPPIVTVTNFELVCDIRMVSLSNQIAAGLGNEEEAEEQIIRH